VRSRGALGESWPIRPDRCVLGGPIRLGGRRFDRGLGVHAPCEVVYELGGRFRRLLAKVGIDDASNGLGSVVFVVIGDGEELWRSGVIRGGDAPVVVSVDVRGVRRVTLRAEEADGLDIGDLADWADARLVREASP